MKCACTWDDENFEVLALCGAHATYNREYVQPHIELNTINHIEEMIRVSPWMRGQWAPNKEDIKAFFDRIRRNLP